MRLSAPERVTLWVYGMLTRLARPLLRRKLRKRAAQEPGYAHDVDARFGQYGDHAQRAAARASGEGAAPLIWVHAVSLGEARAAAILVVALRRQLPAMRLLLTHSTATGWAEGTQLLKPNDCQTWLPWDDAASVQRFLIHFRPTVGVLMETEVWPLLVHTCQQRGVPLALANARLNEASARQAARLAWLSRPAYAGLTAIWAQTAADAQRLTQLGAQVSAVTGNLKFDATPDAGQCAQAAAWRNGLTRPVVMLASSREGEELEFIKHFMAMSLTSIEFCTTNNISQGVQGLIVPRHPQRFDAVADLLRAQGCVVRRRADWGRELDEMVASAPATGQHAETAKGTPVTHTTRAHAAGQADAAQAVESTGSGDATGAPLSAASADAGAVTGAPVVWLGDSLGEMALYYSLADVALLGGSFEPLGGQNLIEAAACGCPLVVGPHTFNFADAAAQAVAMKAAIRVNGMQAAVDAARALVANNQQRGEAVAAARAFAGSQQGAAAAMAEAVTRLLPLSGSAGR